MMTFPFAQSTLRMSAQSNTVSSKKFDFLGDLTLFFLFSLLQKLFNTELFLKILDFTQLQGFKSTCLFLVPP